MSDSSLLIRPQSCSGTGDLHACLLDCLAGWLNDWLAVSLSGWMRLRWFFFFLSVSLCVLRPCVYVYLVRTSSLEIQTGCFSKSVTLWTPLHTCVCVCVCVCVSVCVWLCARMCACARCTHVRLCEWVARFFVCFRVFWARHCALVNLAEISRPLFAPAWDVLV